MPSYIRRTLSLTALAAILSASPAKAQIALFKDSSNTWLQGITLQGEVEGGIMANHARPDNGINFGNFLADHANQAQLNQLSLTLAKAVDTTKAENQFGFTFQALYGSDARYYHLLGISDKITDNRYQIAPIQAHADAHLNILTSGGMDIQAGILEAPMGVEVIEPTARPFYTFSYTAQYSVPFEHLGAMFHLHVTPHFDFNFGIDPGNQTTFGRNNDNKSAAGYFGINLNGLANGKVNIVELSRIGPEDAVATLGRRANTAQRYWNDLSIYYAANDKLSLTGEINFLHDVGLRSENYSFVTYANYKIAPHWALNYRGEIFRDNSGLSVVSFLTNQAYMNAFLGRNAPAESAPPTTYGGLTLGATYSPDLGHGIRVFALRPEIRFDRALNGTSPFNNGRNTGVFTDRKSVV